MAIQSRHGQAPLTRETSPTWGELASADNLSRTVRFVLPGRVVSVPFVQFRWWELVAGEPESLTVRGDRLAIVIEGRGLVAIALALDLHLLAEVRLTREFQSERHTPHVREITVETL